MAPKVARLQQRPAKHAGVNIDLRITKHSQQQKRAYLVTIPHPRAWTPQGRLAKKTPLAQNGGAPLASPFRVRPRGHRESVPQGIAAACV